MIITDLTWLKKFVNIACLQIYKIISILCVVDQLSVVTSGTIRSLTSKDVNIQNSLFILHRITSWYSQPYFDLKSIFYD